MSASMFCRTKLIRATTEWLDEDISSFDVGGHVVGDASVQAIFYCKSKRPVVVAGFPFVDAILAHLGVRDGVQWLVEEGETVNAGTVSGGRVPIGKVAGPAFLLLQAERTALEVLTRCSACASYGRLCVSRAQNLAPSWRGVVAATRKTTPGHFRLVEKYGAIVGGCDPHRYNLSSMVMLKDNHVDVAGSVPLAVSKARQVCGFSTKIEVECRSLQDAWEAARAGADVVMLDNMKPSPSLKQHIESLRTRFPHLLIEMSGGVNADTIGEYVRVLGNSVDIVSVGLITHGPPPVDISMKVDTTQFNLKKQHTKNSKL